MIFAHLSSLRLSGGNDIATPFTVIRAHRGALVCGASWRLALVYSLRDTSRLFCTKAERALAHRRHVLRIACGMHGIARNRESHVTRAIVWRKIV